MSWASSSEFFAMGGYGLYVWGSFGLCLVALLIEPVLLRHRRAAALRSLGRRVRAGQLEEHA